MRISHVLGVAFASALLACGGGDSTGPVAMDTAQYGGAADCQHRLDCGSTSPLAACTTESEAGVARSGGYFVQLLPEADRPLLMIMTERLASFPPLSELLADDKLTAQGLLNELLYGMPFAITSESQVAFGCHCSQERLLASLASLPRADVADMIRDNQPLEIKCDGCNKEYVVTPAELIAAIAPDAAGTLFGGDGTPGDA